MGSMSQSFNDEVAKAETKEVIKSQTESGCCEDSAEGRAESGVNPSVQQDSIATQTQSR